jgi:diketogulonate reductase-like aldo/keto reductase
MDCGLLWQQPVPGVIKSRRHQPRRNNEGGIGARKVLILHSLVFFLNSTISVKLNQDRGFIARVVKVFDARSSPEGNIMTLTASNPVPIPNFMYGTAWKKAGTKELVQLAVASGFRAIDTANQLVHYEEALVGEALHVLEQQGIKRETLFLQTKFTSVDGQDHRTPYDPAADLATQVRQSFESSLTHLGTAYLDSYVLHAPFQRRGLRDADWEVWAAMEELYESGKAKMIGISNVAADQLEELCDNANHKPMVVQNRCFAALGWDKRVRDICQAHGIIYQGFSLLTANRAVLVEPEIRVIARRLGADIAQVIFRFAMQIGMLPLTGTTSAQHMKEDLEAEQFTLSTEEIQRIESIAR